MDMTEAHLRTNKISWRFAPAAMAARIWRRVPSGFRLVREAVKPISTNSMNLVGKIPSADGFVIFTACPAQTGSHSRSLFSAATQELAVWSLPGVFAVSSDFGIFSPSFFTPLGD